jgi:hypothetical protein
MRIVTCDGKNFRNLDYLISALQPGTEGEGEPPTLIVTMLCGEPCTLTGSDATAMLAYLRSASLVPPAGPQPSPTGPPIGSQVVVGHELPVEPQPTAGANNTGHSGIG